MHSHELLTSFTVAAALGVCLFTLAGRLRISAIVVLLLGGILVGPEGLGLVHPEALGRGLTTIISLAVAIILFEGGLTLDLKGYRTVSGEIWRILTIGVLVTWLGSAALLHLLFGYSTGFCLLAASLIIVTGPTVIAPMLHRIRVVKKLHHILYWEGVLIDPIGVFIALLSFEYFISTDGTQQLVVKDFFMRFAVGASVGITFGLLLDMVLRREWIKKGHVNIFVLAMAMLNFALADLIIAESGLLSVTIAGLILGARKAPQLHDIVNYKVELKDFLIGLLFVLLAANLELHRFLDYGWKLAAVVAGIMLLIRPLNVFISMRGSSLDLKDKLFLSWIAPRGIVAASMASIFALRLQETGHSQAHFLETFTYSVIAGTVVVQGFSAGWVGRRLGVLRPVPGGWVIIGAHALGRAVARFLSRNGMDSVLVDTNAREVRAAQREGLSALSEDAMQLNPEAHPALYGCGNLLALTANADLNRMLCHRWSEILEGTEFYRWEKAGYETAEQQHLLTGKSLWTELPLNLWMQPGSEKPPLEIRWPDSPLPPDPANVVLAIRGERATAGPLKELQDDDRAWLVYDAEKGRKKMDIPLLSGDVLFSSQDHLPGLYRVMLEHLAKRYSGIDPESFLADMQRREEEYTSLLGHGIAMPHTRSDAVDRCSLVVARPLHPVRCPQSERDIDIVFMLISPPGQPNEHLRHISHIARLIGTESLRQALLQAPDADSLYRVIASS